MSARKVALIVDDDPDLVALLRQYLETEGFAVTVADRAIHGVNQYMQDRPALMLLDINMPGSDGFFALKRIYASRQRDPQTHRAPIIMISSRDHIHDIEEALEYGATDYITKPIDKVEFIRKLRKHLNY